MKQQCEAGSLMEEFSPIVEMREDRELLVRDDGVEVCTLPLPSSTLF
jgi:hypothetical protein